MMSEDVVQLHVDFVDDLLATHETSGPRPRRTPAAAPAIGASEQTWDAWASLTGNKRGSATWLSVRAEAASKTPEAIARRLQNDEAAAKRLRVDGEIMRRRRAEADAVEKKDKEQFERLERAREKESKKRLERATADSLHVLDGLGGAYVTFAPYREEPASGRGPRAGGRSKLRLLGRVLMCKDGTRFGCCSLYCIMAVDGRIFDGVRSTCVMGAEDSELPPPGSQTGAGEASCSTDGQTRACSSSSARPT